MDSVHGEREAEFDLLDTEGHPLKKAFVVVLVLVGLAGRALLIAYFDFLRHWTAIHTGTTHSTSSRSITTSGLASAVTSERRHSLERSAWAPIPGSARSTVIPRGVGGSATTR
jgi:hypothetical protein